MKDEYSNGQQFQQLFVRKSLGLGKSVCLGNYCPGTEARVGFIQTRVQPSAVWPDVLSCIAFSAMNMRIEERLIDRFIFLTCGFRSELEGGNVPLGPTSPAGLAAGSQGLPGSKYRDEQRQHGLNPKHLGDYLSKCGK